MSAEHATLQVDREQLVPGRTATDVGGEGINVGVVRVERCGLHVRAFAVPLATTIGRVKNGNLKRAEVDAEQAAVVAVEELQRALVGERERVAGRLRQGNAIPGNPTRARPRS